jgi:hypothetical protein
LQISSGGSIFGNISFEGGDGTGNVVPTILLYSGGDPAVGGMSMNTWASVNLLNKSGEFRSHSDVAIDAVHELLHTIRLDHPFETTQSEDTKLLRSINNYLTTSTTDPNIIYNIMSYSISTGALIFNICLYFIDI